MGKYCEQLGNGLEGRNRILGYFYYYITALAKPLYRSYHSSTLLPSSRKVLYLQATPFSRLNRVPRNTYVRFFTTTPKSSEPHFNCREVRHPGHHQVILHSLSACAPAKKDPSPRPQLRMSLPFRETLSPPQPEESTAPLPWSASPSGKPTNNWWTADPCAHHHCAAAIVPPCHGWQPPASTTNILGPSQLTTP